MRFISFCFVLLCSHMALYAQSGSLSGQALVNWRLPDLHGGAIKFGDFDQDGDEDLLLSGSDSSGTPNTILLRNNGYSQGFDTVATTFPPLTHSSADWGDFDNDGDQDLVLTGRIGKRINTSRIYRNLGNGTFSLHGQKLIGLDSGTSNWKDLDGDGDLDLFITGFNFIEQAHTAIYRNDGGGKLTNMSSLEIPGVVMGSVAFADFDNDLDMDILLTGTNQQNAGITKLYLNQGNLVFEESPLQLPDLKHGSVNFGDFNLDQNPDLLLSGMSNLYESFLFQNSGGSLQSYNFQPPPIVFGQQYLLDFNQDGRPDITGIGSSTLSDTIVFYKNLASGFSSVPTPALKLYDVKADWTDLNADALLDIFITGIDDANKVRTIVLMQGLSNFYLIY